MDENEGALPPEREGPVIPYDRIVQWVAGPVAALIGVLSTAVMHSAISKNAALNVATLAVTAGFAYAAHHHWVSNLAKWWDKSAAGDVAPIDLDTADDIEAEIARRDPLQQTPVDQSRADGNELAHRGRV